MIKVFEAFAGYGTTTFALKQLGIEHELVGFSEIDKYAIQCFQQNHGGKNFGDITKIDWSEVPDFDLLTGGFPCQSFSVAGKGLGHLDERGVLANYLTKALIEKQPKYFLFENVKGFMSKKHLEFRKTLFNDWCNAGYNITYKVLNTKDFGIPQNRERVWIIGIRKDIKQFGDFSFPEPFELKLKLKDVLESEVDDKYYLRKEQVDKIVNSSFVSRRDLLQKKDECSALRARYYKEPKCVMLDVSQIKREGVPRVYEDASKTLNTSQGGGNVPLIALGCAVRTFPRQGKGLDGVRHKRLELNKNEEAYALTKVQHDSMVVFNLQPRNPNRPSVIKALAEGRPVPGGSGLLTKSDGTNYCLDTNNSQAVSILDLYNKKEHFNRSPSLTEPHHNTLRVKENMRVRKLTPKECFRLQGFLKDEVNLDGLSDTQKYKLAGNGQSVNVVKLLFKELLKSWKGLRRNGFGC